MAAGAMDIAYGLCVCYNLLWIARDCYELLGTALRCLGLLGIAKDCGLLGIADFIQCRAERGVSVFLTFFL